MHTASAAQFTDASLARAFLLAGHARFTLVSRKRGTRFTYQVTKGKDDNSPHFVALLSGPCNTDDYRFLGSIFADGGYRHGRKSKIGPEAPSARAFAWAWARLASGEIPAELEVWHEGRCGRCGRALTVPESIAIGIGPVCEERAAA
jgi:hypothetical protein